MAEELTGVSIQITADHTRLVSALKVAEETARRAGAGMAEAFNTGAGAAAKQGDALAHSLEYIAKESENAARGLGDLGGAAGGVLPRLKAVEDQASKMDQAFSGLTGLGQRISDLGRTLTVGVTLPLVAAAGAAVKFASDFDGEMRKVTSLLGGTTQQEFEALRGQVLELARSMGIDATKAAAALYEAISAGVKKENAIEFLAVASKAAIAGVTDTKVAVDGLTSIINAYGLRAEQATEVSDAMFRSVNIGKFTFEQLAASIGTATPVASQLGVGFKDLLAAGATLTQRGLTIAQAFDQLRGVMLAIITPNKEMNELLGKTGYASGQALLKAKGLHSAIEALRKEAGNNAEQFAKAIGRAEALGAALGITGDNAKIAAGHLREVKEAAGDTAKGMAEIEKSATRQFERALQDIKNIGIDLGNSILPAIRELLKAAKPFVETLAEMVKWFAALPEPVRNSALAFGLVTAAMGPTLVGFGQMLVQIPQAIIALRSMAGAMSALSTATGALGITFKSLPWVVLATGIGHVLGKMLDTPTAMENIKKAADQKAEGLERLNGKWRENQVLLGNLAPKSNKAYESLLDFVKGLDKTAASAGKAVVPVKTLAEQIEALEKAQKPLEESVRLATLEYERLVRSFQTGNASAAQVVAAYNRMQAAQDRLDPKKHADEMDRAFDQQVQAAEKWSKETEKLLEDVATQQQALAHSSGELSRKFTDAFGDMAKAGLKTVEITKTWREVLPANIKAAIDAIGHLNDAYKQLGVESPGELNKLAQTSRRAWELIAADVDASAVQQQRAYIGMLEAQMYAAREAGQRITEEQKKQLDKAKAQLEDSLGDQTSTWKRWRDGILGIFHDMGRNLTRALIDVFSSDWNRNLDEQARELRDSLTERKRDLDDFIAETGQKIQEVTDQYARQLADETAELRASLSEREDEYSRYAQEIAAQEREIARVADETLRQALDDLEANLRERARAMERFAVDTNRQLQMVGQDLAETLQDLAQRGNRSIEDENVRHSRDMEDLQARLAQAQRDGRREETEAIQRELQRRADDHARSLQRIREDQARAEAEARRRAQEQIEQLRLRLQHEQEEYALYVEQVNAQREEITRINRENLARELADVRAQLLERKAALEEYRQKVEADIIALNAKYKEGLDKEIADLNAAMQAKIAEHSRFNAEVQTKLMELEEAHRSTWEKIGMAMASVFKQAGAALAEFVGSELWKALYDRLKRWFDGATAATKAMQGVPGAIPGGAPGSVPTPTTAPTGAPAGGSPGGGAGDLFGLANPITAISSAVTAISSVIGNFQFAHMNTALGRIEESTRRMNILTEELRDRANLFWPHLQNIHEFNWGFLAGHVARLEFLLESILEKIGGIGTAMSRALAPAGGGAVPEFAPLVPVGGQTLALATPSAATYSTTTAGGNTYNTTLNATVRGQDDIDRLMSAFNEATGRGRNG